MSSLRFLEEEDVVNLPLLSESYPTKVIATVVDANGNIVEVGQQSGLTSASIAAAVIFPILFVAVVIGAVVLWKRRAASKDNAETANAKSIEPEIGDEYAAERSGGIFDTDSTELNEPIPCTPCMPGTNGEEPGGEQTYGQTYGEQTFGEQI